MSENEETLTKKLHDAVAHFKNGNFRKAVVLFSQVVELMGNFSERTLIQIRRHYGLTDRPPVGKLIHPKLLDILDQRIACFEKLNDLKLGYRDVKLMLDMDPTSCKGHLRIGKLYLREGREVDAYKAYQRGLFTIERAVEKLNIQVSPKLLGKLKSQYRELNRALKEKDMTRTKTNLGALKRETRGSVSESTPQLLADRSSDLLTKTLSLPKKRTVGLQSRLDEMLPLAKRMPEHKKKAFNARDPMEQLPLELVEFIFSLLPHYSLLRCHLVCRNWYYKLTNIPSLYTNSFVLKQGVTSSEYFSGLQLMKRILRRNPSKALKTIRLRTTKSVQCLASIFKSLVSDKELQIELLELINTSFNMDILMKSLNRTGFQYQHLESVRNLQLATYFSLEATTIILELFPSLDTFHLVTLGDDPDFKNENYEQSSAQLDFLKKASTHKKHLNMRRLHIDNRHGRLSLSGGSMIYNTGPPFSNIEFPNLVELRITSFNLVNHERLIEFFSRIENLKILHLERNSELSLSQLFNILKVACPKFRLKTLTHREALQHNQSNLNELSPSDLPCLLELETLDLYGTSLSSANLHKLMQITNQRKLLKNINLGNVAGLPFPNDSLAFSRNILKFSTLFEAIPKLQCLALPNKALDNLSMRSMAASLEQIYGKEWKLDRLDLSFCLSIDGVAIMSLLGGNLQPFRSRIGVLIIDGLSINAQTLNFLKHKGIVGEIIHTENLVSWREYGENVVMGPFSKLT